MNTEIIRTSEINKMKVQSNRLFLSQGAAMVILGVVLILFPLSSDPNGLEALGIYFLAAGLINNITVWRMNSGNELNHALLPGLLGISIGINIMIFPSGSDFLSQTLIQLLLAGSMIFFGVLNLSLCNYLDENGWEKWTWAYYIIGIISIGFGLIITGIIFIPLSSWHLITPLWPLVGGIGLIFLGSKSS